MAAEICPRCKTRMAPDRTDDGPVWKCLSCGQETPRAVDAAGRQLVIQHRAVAGSQPMPELSRVLPANGTTPAASWDEQARRELDGHIAEYVAREENRRKAERIHAALTAYGTADLPALPWRPVREPWVAPPERKSEVTRPDEIGQVMTPDCIFCGLTFVSVTQRVHLRAGSACRSINACGRRKAARDAATTAATEG